MATQFTFTLPDTPGSLATIAASLASADINIEGIAGMTYNGQGRICLVTSNFEAAETSLKGSGIPFETQEVLMIHLENKPGQIAKLSQVLADEGINFNTFYITMRGYQVIGTSNMTRTNEVAAELGLI